MQDGAGLCQAGVAVELGYLLEYAKKALRRRRPCEAAGSGQTALPELAAIFRVFGQRGNGLGN